MANATHIRIARRQSDINLNYFARKSKKLHIADSIDEPATCERVTICGGCFVGMVIDMQVAKSI